MCVVVYACEYVYVCVCGMCVGCVVCDMCVGGEMSEEVVFRQGKSGEGDRRRHGGRGGGNRRRGQGGHKGRGRTKGGESAEVRRGAGVRWKLPGGGGGDF